MITNRLSAAVLATLLLVCGTAVRAQSQNQLSPALDYSVTVVSYAASPTVRLFEVDREAAFGTQRLLDSLAVHGLRGLYTLVGQRDVAIDLGRDWTEELERQVVSLMAASLGARMGIVAREHHGRPPKPDKGTGSSQGIGDARIPDVGWMNNGKPIRGKIGIPDPDILNDPGKYLLQSRRPMRGWSFSFRNTIPQDAPDERNADLRFMNRWPGMPRIVTITVEKMDEQRVKFRFQNGELRFMRPLAQLLRYRKEARDHGVVNIIPNQTLAEVIFSADLCTGWKEAAGNGLEYLHRLNRSVFWEMQGDRFDDAAELHEVLRERYPAAPELAPHYQRGFSRRHGHKL
jgi:hypothetical protein